MRTAAFTMCMFFRIVLLILLPCHTAYGIIEDDKGFYCAYSNREVTVSNDHQSPLWVATTDSNLGRLLVSQEQYSHQPDPVNGHELCTEQTPGQKACSSFWMRDKHGKVSLVKQGCWIPAGTECLQQKCRYETAHQMNYNLSFCCCYGSMCNKDEDVSNVDPMIQTDKPTPQQQLVVRSDVEKTATYCAYKQKPHSSAMDKMLDNSDTPDLGLGKLMPDGHTVQCQEASEYCFTFWVVNPSNKSVDILMQGCWLVSAEISGCYKGQCVPNLESHHNQNLKNSHFCCCSGNMCNNNFSNELVTRLSTTTQVSTGPAYHAIVDPSYKERTIVISLLSVCSLAVIIFGVYLLYRFCLLSPKPPIDPENTVEAPSTPRFDFEDLKFCSMIHKGHYSEVWRGSLNEQPVAIKIYHTDFKHYYQNEKYIYNLPHMDHENLLKFYGADEHVNEDGSVRFMLVFSYIEGGMLTSFLKNNKINWNTMCKMCYTLAKGLAHLHSDIGTVDDLKPTVAHRDIKSRNILVTLDHSCIIADLGFCMPATGSKLIHKHHVENAEQSSLTDVGTIRYMAPELLDCAVNLRDCEASLKQIDIYSLGLVLWEIATQCSDLYQGAPMPDYSLPFQAEAGIHPTFEEMQEIVSRNKQRPKFPEVWKDYNQAVHALKSTIEECWDHDAEARLTAQCVEERILELKNLWTLDNKHKGVTPTINGTILSHVSSSNKPGYHSNTGLQSITDSLSPNIVAEGKTTALIINDIHSHNPAYNIESFESAPSYINEISSSTIESTVPITPGDSDHPPPKFLNLNHVPKNQCILPPHQGRNPVAERNTHKRSDEELTVSGNNLVYGKDKSDSSRVMGQTSQSQRFSGQYFDSLSDNMQMSLVQNDTLNQHRNPPISFVQNPVAVNLQPKMANNPTNSAASAASSRNPGNSKLQKLKKSKDTGLFGHLAFLGRLAWGGGKKSTTKNSSSVTDALLEGGNIPNGAVNTQFESQPSVQMEVRLLKGSNVITQPAHLSGGYGTNIGYANHAQRHQPQPTVEVGVARLVEPHGQHSVFRLRGAPYSKSTSDLSPQKSASFSKLEEECVRCHNPRARRPSTLSLRGHNYSRINGRGEAGSSISSLAMFKRLPGNSLSNVLGGKLKSSGTSQSQPSLDSSQQSLTAKDINMNRKICEDPNEKIKTRVKTPLSMKKGRLSLYDDRLMSDMYEEDCELKEQSSKKPMNSISVQKFKNLNRNSHPYRAAADCTC
ncbi:hypothetical protein CHS0354_003854 [Potamilus streckersoni]|uniref:receptor protein serine/threonine kinase n=1 Tax=Potamilus streckersoni TaxID=2493646 RepID=A0AAE0SFZ8_9BIVA|nr:hypothetical protein CHS0354_003854 [Potamilus streckersoni]